MLGSRTKKLTFWLMFWTWAFSTNSGRNSRRFFSCPGKISLALTFPEDVEREDLTSSTILQI